MSTRLEDWVPRVYRFALRLCGNAHVAEDLTQETFLRAWRDQTNLRDVATMRSWLFRIAANLWRDWARRDRLPVGRAGPLPDVAFQQTDALTHRDDVDEALAALNELPGRQREVIHLVACEEMSIAEVAEVLSISPAAVKASLSLGRKALRARMSIGQPKS